MLQITSETKQFRDWSATCGNDGTCWAFGFTSGNNGGWVRLALDPGPDAKPQVVFGYWPDGDAKGPARIGLTIDGRDFAAALNDASEDDAPIGQIAGDARPVIDALTQGKVMTIRGVSSQDISLHGAAAALLWIDEKQGRLDTPTALMRRGDKPASSVPVAPVLPTVAAAPAVNQSGFGDQNQTLPAALRSRTEVGDCLKESAMPAVGDMVMSARLDARTELWAVPCGSGAYNLTHNWYVTGPGGRDPRPAALVGTAGPGADPNMPDNATVNGEYDPGSRTLSAFARGARHRRLRRAADLDLDRPAVRPDAGKHHGRMRGRAVRLLACRVAHAVNDPEVLVIGAGPAGLTAATYLARFRRRTLVIDAGQPRACWIPLSHNTPGFPAGVSGPDILARMREQAEEYGAVIAPGRVEALARDGQGFIAEIDGRSLRARAVLLATGVVDHHPDLPGVEPGGATGSGPYLPDLRRL